MPLLISMSRTLLFIMQSITISIQGGTSVTVGCKTNPRLIFFLNKYICFSLCSKTTAVIKGFRGRDDKGAQAQVSAFEKYMFNLVTINVVVNALNIRPDLLDTCFCWRERSAHYTHDQNELKRMSSNQCKINLSYFTQGCLLGIRRKKLNRSTLAKGN